jgi:hypothetical protein
MMNRTLDHCNMCLTACHFWDNLPSSLTIFVPLERKKLMVVHFSLLNERMTEEYISDTPVTTALCLKFSPSDEVIYLLIHQIWTFSSHTWNNQSNDQTRPKLNVWPHKSLICSIYDRFVVVTRYKCEVIALHFGLIRGRWWIYNNWGMVHVRRP